jgi:hypothetical protein
MWLVVLIQTGPLGCNLLVDIPTSEPSPNSYPSANCVEVLFITIELGTSLKIY